MRNLLSELPNFMANAKNRTDLYHVSTPLILALAMSPSSFGGALLFLLVWGLLRGLGHG